MCIHIFVCVTQEDSSRWVKVRREREELLVPEEVKYHVDDQEMMDSSSRSLKDLAGTGGLFSGDGKVTPGKHEKLT